MAFLHRKMLVRSPPGEGFTFSITCCRAFTPPPPPSPEYDHDDVVSWQRSGVTLPIITMICIVGGVLLFLCLVAYLYFAIKRSQLNQAMATRDASRQEEEEDGDRDFSGQDWRTHIDHHIWHIATVGLRRSAINSITAFRFKKEERLIDGTDCSVCLNEFKENELLRLLPKCSHAFHIDCIDTWLLSHKNCPLCRAPVLANETVSESLQTNHSDNPSSSNEPRSEERNGNTSEVGDGTEDKDRFPGSRFRNPNFLSRAQSDLANHCRAARVGAVRRSVSIGSSLQRPIHFGVKLLSWTSSRIEDPVLPTRQPSSESG
ncbi:PREDICTED: E3 ubiquitin-protein ligase RING1 [Tarenaya hassleriana]|uniref:E3 ubiquitin-protein ligase RING1 n=1 Tax=Tarenaya hassleriana TaxID=28532 RepID=UPI00053CAA60|nr:PREDICTED: E3 ubiquitin-protein ligase RING1 [Tarenaya hassleriana]